MPEAKDIFEKRAVNVKFINLHSSQIIVQREIAILRIFAAQIMKIESTPNKKTKCIREPVAFNAL